MLLGDTPDSAPTSAPLPVGYSEEARTFAEAKGDHVDGSTEVMVPDSGKREPADAVT